MRRATSMATWSRRSSTVPSNVKSVGPFGRSTGGAARSQEIAAARSLSGSERLLPRTLHLSAAHIRTRADLASTVEALGREYDSGARGSSLVVTRLLEILVVQVLRSWADEQPPGGAG
jgi:hypothetical protein